MKMTSSRFRVEYTIISLIAFLFLGFLIYGFDNILYIMMAYIFFLNLINSFERTDSKVFAILLLVILFILMSGSANFNGSNTDYHANNSLYEHFLNGGTFNNITGYQTDTGYMILMFLFSKTNLTYNYFVGFFTMIAIVLCFKTIKKITSSYNFVLICYMLTPFFYDVYQFRFFLAYTLVLFALKFILFEDERSYIKYTLLIILASFIHFSMLFYLAFLLIFFNKKIIRNLVLVASVLVAAFCYITGVNIVAVVSSIVNLSQGSTYASIDIYSHLNIFTSIAVILIQLFYMFISYISYQNDKSYTNKTLLMVNVLCSILFPFNFVSLEFERFLRPILLLDYALLTKNYRNFRNYKSVLLLIGSLIIVSLRNYISIGIAYNVFENNYIVEFLMNFINR